MARSVSLIQSSILAAVAADPTLSALNSPSKTAIYRLWSFIIATEMAYEEQLQDKFITEVETIVSRLAPATSRWIQDRSFKFQYSSTVPQIIQFDPITLAPYYTVENDSYKIISNCSVSNPSLNIVNIKVAKGTITTPVPLSADELDAFQFYMNQIKPAGIIYNCLSITSDKLRTECTVYFNGSYSGVIRSSLLTAYNNYLTNIPFGGSIKLVDIILALRNVPGVNDIIINNMTARSNSTSFGGGTSLVSSNTVINPEYSTVAGYIIDETESSNDFLTLLTLIPS